jgi:hypothetical protein
MDLLIARRLAGELMQQHGLIASGWRFAFDDSTRCFGKCNYGKKVIFLSRPLTLVVKDEKVKDTILHEIAHCLCPGEHHNAIWKQKAISIGCRGERCGDVTKEAIDEFRLDKFKKVCYDYQYTCPTCSYITYSNHVNRTALCSKCYVKGTNVYYKIKKL